MRFLVIFLSLFLSFNYCFSAPPSFIAITSPPAGSYINKTVTIEAQLNQIPSARSVKFYIDGKQVGEDTTSPYQYSWDTTSYPDGQHTLYASILQAPQRPGNIPPVLDSPKITVTVDNSPPSVPIVSDDGVYTNSKNKLHGSWTPSTDPESGVKEYQYAIGTTKGGTDVLSWTSNGLNTEFTREGLSLTEGQAYYIAVKAINGANLSSIGYSDGIIVDSIAPQIAITSPQNGSISNTQTITLSGTIDDNQAIVAINGNPVTISGNIFSSELLLTEGVNTITVSSTDPAGNSSSYSFTLTYQPDIQPPSGEPIVTFSSPYANQLVTENKLEIGGSFNSSANVTAITVNGQACILDFTNNTFTGPMLLSPGQARRDNKTSVSEGYIIMNVDPDTHSGKNTLKVSITDSFGRTDKQELTFYYYQLFVKSAGQNIQYGALSSQWQSWNLDLFNECPFGSSWTQLDKESRITPPWRYQNNDDPMNMIFAGLYTYARLYQTKAFDTSLVKDASTNLLFHSLPRLGNKITPMLIAFKGIIFDKADLDYSAVRINGKPLNKLYTGSSTWPTNAYYIILDSYEPDSDSELSVEGIPSMTWSGIDASGNPVSYEDSYFDFSQMSLLTGDILVDSNNDGFLGGDDNAVEQVAPGCVFWVNDDDDYDESTVHQDDNNPNLASEIDCEDEIINGIRDLEDFMPINLTIPNIKEWSDPKKNVKFLLKMEGQGKIRIFKRVNDAYLTNLRYSKTQYQQQPLPPDENNVNEIPLDPNLFNSEGKFYGIFEGVSAGQLKLTLYVDLNNGQDKVVLNEVNITLKNLNGMYRFCNVRYNTVGYGNAISSKEIITDNEMQGPELDNNGIYRYIYNYETGCIYPDNPKELFFWTHGYYNDAKQAKIVTDTVFKRMYRTGYRGAFIGITWHAHEGWTQLAFNADWINSFQSGRIIADVITRYKMKYSNAKASLSAHSLGNNAISYAIRLIALENAKIPIENRITLENLILAEAAVPGETFSGYEPKRKGYYFDNIYGIDTTVVKKVYNTFSENDKVLKDAWSANNCLSGLETPLDDDYNLINRNPLGYLFPQEALRAPLGINAAESTLSNFENESFYIKKNEGKKHPYGIRSHGSMMDEYYYDVQNFYNYVLDPKPKKQTGGNK